MPSPEGRLIAPGPMEQLPPGQALMFINAWGEEFDAAEPPAYARVYAGEVCDDMTTAPLHPSHEVVDASLDLFKQIAKRLKSPNVRNSILNGVGYAIDRPDGHGAGRVSDILDIISEGYVGIGPATNPGEPSNFGAIKEYASHLRYRAFFNGRDYRIDREHKIEEAGEELGTDTSQQERIFNLVEHFVDTDTPKDRGTFFIAAARMALGREERRQILGAVAPLDNVSEDYSWSAMDDAPCPLPYGLGRRRTKGS